MTRRAALDSLLGGSVLLPFLAPSLRLAPARRSLQPRRALATTPTPRALPQVRVQDPATVLAGWDTSDRTSSSRRAGAGWRAEGQQGLEAKRGRAPVASTSAVRLDSPAHPAPLSPDARASAADAAVDALELRPHAALAAVVTHLRSAYSASPSLSPLDIVRVARPTAFPDDDSAQRPPIPPPPIPLDPQPHASSNRLLTPFLLQALFLGASALGLLARRKVRPPDTVPQETSQRTAARQRQEAEDRVDELQALDLLVTAFAVPEASGAPADSLTWREENIWSVSKLVRRVDAMEAPVSRQTVASVLHVVSLAPPIDAAPSAPPPAPKYSRARPVLGLWAWRAFDSLPARPLSTSPSAPTSLESALLQSFLALLYPPGRHPDDRHFFPADLSGTTDRAVLKSVSKRIFAKDAAPDVELLAAFASAAIRARRVEQLERLITTCPNLDPPLRLAVVTNALRLIAEVVQHRRDGALVVRWAERLVTAVQHLETASSREISDIAWAVRRLREAYDVRPALEPYIATVMRALLASPSGDAALSTVMVVDTLRHLVRSRHPRLARSVFAAIPPPQVQLVHLEALLGSSDAPLASWAWDALTAHPSLQPSARAYEAYLSSLSTRDDSGPPSSARLRTAYRVFLRARRARSDGAGAGAPSTALWNAFLRVVALHGPTPQLRVLLSRMSKDGHAPNARTAALLVERELRRSDAQVRRIIVTGAHGEREERTTRALRRGGAQAQVRRARDVAREWGARLAQGGEEAPVVENLLLKNALRWPREYGIDKLAVLARARLGVDLAPLLDPAFVAGADAQVRKVAPGGLGDAARLDVKRWRQEREPAFRMFAAGMENRGRADLAQVLRRVMQEEKAVVKRQERRRLQRKAGGEKEGVAVRGE